MSRSFPLAVVVSVYRNRLLCPFDDYREFLDYMTGTRLWLHDVARARAAAARAIEKQFPELMATSRPPEKTDSGNASKYVKTVARELGYQDIRLTPLRKGTFQGISPREANR